jgi:hypothetical protein
MVVYLVVRKADMKADMKAESWVVYLVDEMVENLDSLEQTSS